MMGKRMDIIFVAVLVIVAVYMIMRRGTGIS